MATNNLIDSQNSSYPKSFNKILTTLYHSPRISHKVLAASIQTSPSSLSNIIVRMSTITPKLLTNERDGRTVYYSLTDAGKNYVEQAHMADQINHTSSFIVNLSANSLKNNNPIALDAQHLLSHFQKNAGDNWITVLYDYIGGELSDTFDEKNSLNPDNYNIYKNLMNCMTQLKIQKDFSSIKQLYDILNNDILKREMESYLNKKIKIYDNLLPLFHLVDSEKKDSQKRAFMFIEHIFTEIKSPFLVQQTPLPKYPLDSPVNEEEYYRILDSIQAMIKDFFHYNGDVLQVLDHWKKQFFTTNACLYFIALECKTIYSIYHSKTLNQATESGIDPR